MKKIINTIVVPTDFSLSADYAISYAFHLADLIGANIILYHSFIPFESGFYPVAQSTQENLETELVIRNRLLNIKKTFAKNYKKVMITTLVERGPGKIKLINFCKNKKVDLVVMGTKGASGLKEVVLGSFASSIMVSAPCPVLAIPLRAKFKVPTKITFASNYGKNDIFSLKFLLNLNDFFDAKINILHIDNEIGTQNLKKIQFNKYKYKTEKYFKQAGFTYKHIANKNTLQAILLYTIKDRTDLLAISPIIKNGILQWSFHKSIIKAIANHIHLPLLSIPTQ